MSASEERAPEAAAFDGFAGSYCDILDSDLKLAGEDTDLFARIKVERMLEVCRRELGPSSSLAFLDVGCGTGVAEPHLHPHAARVVGADISGKMVQAARQRCPEAEFVHHELAGLPFEDGSFDVTFCFCVLHHVPPDQRGAFVSEMHRVTRPGGLLFTFEHNPLNPVTRHIVNRCPFDHDAVLLWKQEACRLFTRARTHLVESKYYLFFPGPLKFLRPLEKALGWLPLGGQYYVVARKDVAAG